MRFEPDIATGLSSNSNRGDVRGSSGSAGYSVIGLSNRSGSKTGCAPVLGGSTSVGAVGRRAIDVRKVKETESSHDNKKCQADKQDCSTSRDATLSDNWLGMVSFRHHRSQRRGDSFVWDRGV